MKNVHFQPPADIVSRKNDLTINDCREITNSGDFVNGGVKFPTFLGKKPTSNTKEVIVISQEPMSKNTMHTQGEDDDMQGEMTLVKREGDGPRDTGNPEEHDDRDHRP